MPSRPRFELSEVRQLKRISLNNGYTFVEPEEAVKREKWSDILCMMDDTTRKQVEKDCSPDDKIAFLKRYLELAPDHLIL